MTARARYLKQLSANGLTEGQIAECIQWWAAHGWHLGLVSKYGEWWLTRLSGHGSETAFNKFRAGWGTLSDRILRQRESLLAELVEVYGPND